MKLEVLLKMVEWSSFCFECEELVMIKIWREEI